jgi:hypothetical protein
MTLDREEVFNCPMKFVMPNSGAGNKVSGYDTSSNNKDHIDNAITQAQMEELSSASKFTTPKKQKASSMEHLLDSD